MVKAADLGLPSTNLGKARTREEQEEELIKNKTKQAILSLVGNQKKEPKRLTPPKPTRLT